MRYATMVELSAYRLLPHFERRVSALCPRAGGRMFESSMTLGGDGNPVLKLHWFAIAPSRVGVITVTALAAAEKKWLRQPLPALPGHLTFHAKRELVKVLLEHEKAAFTGTPD